MYGFCKSGHICYCILTTQANSDVPQLIHVSLNLVNLQLKAQHFFNNSLAANTRNTLATFSEFETIQANILPLPKLHFPSLSLI